ncbi:hypothetical protein AWW66_19225 [Micromonospora rosaria]|uniref:rRNA methyltransferase n=1 Tax=Micromonospora rosaria TaxID=47874 RepID=A0A136PPG4_9ACTN|nr:hypothetical protein [Micromonospora rosaria]KXK60359.1 hypothetical protein AWW66_19225 [Micromonospora rosaria]
MTYRFATERPDYSDLASGAVLRSAPGHPAFPVRLASEMFLRAWHALGRPRVTVWDPCCGSGYLLTVLGLLHRERIAGIVASDVADGPLRLARANLGLLSADGLQDRAAELDELADRFQRPAHRTAAEAARRLRAQLTPGDPATVVGRADALVPEQVADLLAASGPPDLVLTDVPYGEQTTWQGADPAAGLPGLLDSLAGALPAETMVALATRGRRVPLPAGTRTAARFKIGTRAVALLRLHDVRPAVGERAGR